MKMRRIISKQEEAKKRRINQFIIGGILILVMVMSTIGYSFNRDEEKVEKINYHGFTFTKQEGFWVLDMNKLQFFFKYNPNEVEEINTTLNFLNNYQDKPLYIYSENSEAEIEIYRNLFYKNKIAQRMQYACPEGEKCKGDYPVKSCENNFIIIKEGDNKEVRQQENCVFIQGKSEELAKLADSFLFRITSVQ